MKIRSLRWRILLPPLIIILLSGLILGRYLSQKTYTLQYQTFEERAISETKSIAYSLQSERENIQNWQEFDAFARSWADLFGCRVSIISSSGILLADSNTSPPLNIQLYRLEIQNAIDQGLGVSLEENKDGDVLFIAVPVIINDKLIGIARSSYRLDNLEQGANRIRTTIWVSIFLISLALSVPIVLVTNYSGRRLDQITNAANRIAVGDRDTLIPTGIQDEIGEVAHALNTLGLKLEEQFTYLETEQAKIDSVLHKMNDGVMIVDQEGIIILANEASGTLFKFRADRIKGQRLARVVRYHQIIELWKNYQSSIQEESEYIELQDLKKSVQVIISPLEETLPGHALLLFQDLTHLRKLETVRRDFISNISHELRTPLASLKALAETLQISALDDPEAARKFLSRMDTEIDALAQMVGELLELSRIESGQVSLELSRLDANEILASASERMAVQVHRAKIEFKVKYLDHAAPIYVDKFRIEQVLVNVIHNAIKFTPAGGKIKCSLHIEDAQVIFKVKDTGAGILATDLPRIFERFYKSKRPKSGSGTGLGLSIAKHLIEIHGGTIWAESQYGEGSTFFISLPLQNP